MKRDLLLGSSRAASSIASTRSAVGGTTGRPSVQPLLEAELDRVAVVDLVRLDVSVVVMAGIIRDRGGPACPAFAARPAVRYRP